MQKYVHLNIWGCAAQYLGQYSSIFGAAQLNIWAAQHNIWGCTA